MKLKDRIRQAVAAGCGGIWVRSHEHEDAIKDIVDVAKRQGWLVLTWDYDKGLIAPGTPQNTGSSATQMNQDPSALAAINALRQFKGRDEDNNVLLIMRNLHLAMFNSHSGSITDAMLLQSVQHTIEEGASLGWHIVGLSYDGITLPVEMEKHFLMADHELPDADDLWALAEEIDDGEIGLPERDSIEANVLINAAIGMTRVEAMTAYSMSVARHGVLRPDTLWELKAELLKKTGALEMMPTTITFKDIVGLEPVKDYALRTFRSKRIKEPGLHPRGSMLVGVPGAGKSLFCKALGAEIGRPAIRVDLGAMMGGIVGQTEENTRVALKRIESMAPCVAMFDEIEKMLAGSTGGSTDSGVGARQLGSLLSWLEDRAHRFGIYCVVTANHIELLAQTMPELFRRFDALWFMDMPTHDAREHGWEMYLNKFGLDLDQERPEDGQWTIAEIEKCCQDAARLEESVVESAMRVVPVALTSQERIKAMREWATNRALSADHGGIYTTVKRTEAEQQQRPPTTTPKRKRKINRTKN